eukprot:45266_1
MENSKSDWIKLKSAPRKWLSKPVMINDSEFIVATEKMTAENNPLNEGIFCYNTYTNQWSMYFKYPNDIKLYVEYPTICIDEKNNLLYLHSDKSTLLIINTITKSYKIKYNFGFAGSYAPCVIINNKFHLIGGDRNSHHLIWNDADNKPKDFQIIHTFKDYSAGCENPGFIHVKSENMFLLFGGYDKHRPYGLHREPYKIWYYKYHCDNVNIENDEMTQGWKQYKNMWMPYNIRLFGFAVSIDYKYIILTGGIKLEKRCHQDIIYVIDVKKGIMRRSNVCCPMRSAWHSVIMPQNGMDKLLVNGYLREICELIVIYIPNAIFDLIVGWYSSECVHILKDDGHWKINVNYLHDYVNV